MTRKGEMKKNRQECKLLLANGAFSLKNKYVDPVLFVFAACWHKPIFHSGLDRCNCPNAHCNCGNNRFRKRSAELKTVFK